MTDVSLSIGVLQCIIIAVDYNYSDQKNPGFLHVKFFNLRTKKIKLINVPSRKRAHESFQFDFDVGDVYVDMGIGTMIVSKDTDDLPQNIALGFAVPMLFTLCQPRPPNFVPNHQQPRPTTATFARATDQHRRMHTNDLVFLYGMGYYYTPWYPVYYDSLGTMGTSVQCADELCWDADVCEGDYGAGVDSTGSVGGGDVGGDAGGDFGDAGGDGGGCLGGDGGGCGGGGGDGGGGGGDGGGGGGGCGGGGGQVDWWLGTFLNSVFY